MILMPVNYSAEHEAACLTAGKGQPPETPGVDQLADWSHETYALDSSVAARLGFPIGDVSLTFRRQSLLFEVSRWLDVDSADGHIYRFGVALRALIIVTENKGDAALTLPAVAAKVELNQAQASAQLLIRGYKGDSLGSMLPKWNSFGVDSYADYMSRVSDIQDKVMSDADNIAPQLLATTLPAPTVPPSGASVGAVYALQAIAHGASLTHALDKLHTDNHVVHDAVRSTYLSRIGADEGEVPDEESREAARRDLYGTHLTHGFFGIG